MVSVLHCSTRTTRRTIERTVLLDRDGVINFDSADYIRTPEEWRAIPGSLDAIARLSSSGFRVIVITNQANIGRGLMTNSTLASIHALMQRQVMRRGGVIDGIYVCPHDPSDGCYCRKPNPGLLLDAARDFNFSLAGTRFVGDSRKDLDAAHAAGAVPVLVRTGNGAATELAGGLPDGTEVYGSLESAVNEWLKSDASQNL